MELLYEIICKCECQSIILCHESMNYEIRFQNAFLFYLVKRDEISWKYTEPVILLLD